EALVAFANEQLGLTLTPAYAGTLTAELSTIIAYLPAEMQAYLSAAASLTDAQSFGVWQGGAGAVMVGACSVDNTCAVEAESLSLELTNASAGAYTLLVNTPAPTTTEGALELLTTVYPKLNGLAFAQVTNIEAGLAFTATASSIGYDSNTQAPLSVAKVIYVGVINVNGQALTYALVGVGEAYADLFGQ
nr:hypothetical protein [Anaerolineae bacterium]